MNQYDPSKHHRRSIRLKGYDYTRSGAYFVTFVTQERACLFGQVVQDKMKLNAVGRIVCAEWQRLDRVFENIQLDAFIVMPNHIHGIIIIKGQKDFDEHVNHTVGVTRPCLDEICDRVDRLPDRSSISEGGSPLPPNGLLVNMDGSPQRPAGPAPGSLGAMIGQFKSRATKRIWSSLGMCRPEIWQRNYYEHIVRDNESLDRIRQYILENPIYWEEDELFIPSVP